MGLNMKFGKLYDEMVMEIKKYQIYEDGLKLDELFESEVVLDAWSDVFQDNIPIVVKDVVGFCENNKFIITGKVSNN